MNFSFLYPEFLWASFLIAVPIIIHLFNFRRYKTVYYSNVMFLKNVKQQTKSKSQLKQILVLISRILFILALVFAFAQPFIPNKNTQNNKNKNLVSIYLDNSFSMDAQGQNGKLSDLSKNKVKSIIDSYDASTNFLFLTNDFEAKHQFFYDKNKTLDFIADVNTSPNTKLLSKISAKQSDFLLSEKGNFNRISYIISDFQKTTTDIESLKTDTNISTYLVPLNPEKSSNLFVDSCWFETPIRKLFQKEKLFVKVYNSSDEDFQNIPIKLYINDSLKALGSININSNKSEIVELNYTNSFTGFYNAYIEIADYPIVYDNTLFFNYSINKTVNILEIYGTKPNSFLSALFKDDNYVKLENQDFSKLNFSEIDKYNSIILNELPEIGSGLQQVLINFISEGNSVFVIPSFKLDFDSYNSFLKNVNSAILLDTLALNNKINNINYNNDIYKDAFVKSNKNVEYPYVNKMFLLNKSYNNTDLLKTENNLTILSESSYNQGKVYILTMPLNTNYSNFVQHQMFVPTFYNFALNTNKSGEIYSTIGNTIYVTVKDSSVGDNVYHIKNSTNTVDFIPEFSKSGNKSKITVKNNITKAGNYFVEHNNKTLKYISLNYNRKESDLSYYSKSELEEIISENNLNISVIKDSDNNILSNYIGESSNGKQFWKWFLISALAFLLIEILLLRFFKARK